MTKKQSEKLDHLRDAAGWLADARRKLTDAERRVAEARQEVEWTTARLENAVRGAVSE